MSQALPKILHRGFGDHHGADGRLLVRCPRCRVLCRRLKGWIYLCRICGEHWQLADPPTHRRGEVAEPWVLDHLALVTERERAARRFVRRAPESDSVWRHVFRCAVCGELKSEDCAREPGSKVCVDCVRDAGFEE
jgi:hypothetical protein